MSTETEVLLHVPDLPSRATDLFDDIRRNNGEAGESPTSSRGILLIWRNCRIQKKKKRTKHVFPFQPEKQMKSPASPSPRHMPGRLFDFSLTEAKKPTDKEGHTCTMDGHFARARRNSRQAKLEPELQPQNGDRGHGR